MNTTRRNTTRRAGIAALVALVALALPFGADAQQDSGLQHYRPFDKAGINVFEPPKDPGVPFDGLEIEWGAAFTQQFQALDHSNAATPDFQGTVDQNRLIDLGYGFNLATANLYLGAQLAEGIRVHLTTYLSSRHHPEAWVKEGYLLVDRVPMIENETLDGLMDYVTLRMGHFEINYGDTHFRRTDNGNAMYNPFVGNYIMDSFTTEIGGEVYVRNESGLMGMVALTGGEIRGAVDRPDDRGPSFYAKAGFDRQLEEDLRVRLTGSVYTTSKSISNTLYAGDRAGSRYYLVMENTGATVSSDFRSGRLNPGFTNEVTALMVNPFVKAGGLEFFGVLEWASGAADGETADRDWSQYAGEVVYRFMDEERAYVGGRYNTAGGRLAGFTGDVSVERLQLGAGWFLTENLLMKGEFVRQIYNDFPITDIRSGGEFDGIMIEGVVAF